MSYYARDRTAGGDGDFDAYDPTPYSGGYDIDITYGRSLPATAETCYPASTATTATSSYGRNDNVVDNDHPSYSSYSQPSAYAEEALENEYRSYSRPPSRPPPSFYGCPPDPPPPFYGCPPGPPGYGFGPPPPGPPPPGYGEREFGGPGQEYEKPRHGYKKHGGDDSSSDDSDEEKKQRHHHHHHHHHHRGYDD